MQEKKKTFMGGYGKEEEEKSGKNLSLISFVLHYYEYFQP